MNREQIRVDRETLYERVWSTPISRLAPEYGLSDVGLAKLCKRLDVPRPGLGYWTKVKCGKAEKRPALPPSRVSEVFVAKRERRTAPAVRKSSAPRIPVPSLPEEPHPLVRKTMRALARARSDGQGVLQFPRKGLLPLHVTPETKDRALRLMDALLRGLESRGHEVRVNQGEDSAAAVSVNEEFVSFSL